MSLFVFKIDGMHCASCSTRLEKTLIQHDKIDAANVNLSTEKAYVRSQNLTAEQIIKIVAETGFSASVFDNQQNLQNKQNNEKQISEKANLILAAILTLPLILPMFLMFADSHNFELPRFFQAVLASVVEFYCGRKFFIGAFASLKHKSANMDVLVVLGTLVAFIFSLFITIWDLQNLPVYFESSAVIITLVLLGQFLEHSARKKTAAAIESLTKLTPKTAMIFKKNSKNLVENFENSANINIDDFESVEISAVLKNDIFLVKVGDSIPCDGSIIHGNSAVDESMLSGENLPVIKNVGDKVFAGTINLNSVLICQTTQTAEHTLLAQIIQRVEEAQNSKAPIQRLTDKIASIFVPSVVGIALATFLAWYFIFAPYDLQTALINSISVLVIACPCALGLATPAALMVGIGIAAKFGVLIRNAQVLEYCANIGVMAFDKTGTLTNGKPEVINMQNFINANENENENSAKNLDFYLQLILQLEKQSNHPLALAMQNFCQQKISKISKISNINSTNFHEISIKNFEEIAGKGIFCCVDENNYFLGNLENSENSENSKKNNQNLVENLQNLQNSSLVALYENDNLILLFSLQDSLRQNAKNIIQTLQNDLQIQTIMLTGDNSQTAENIGKQVGILPENIVAKILPNHKAQEISKIKSAPQNQYKIIAMIGDGINDAPALSQADVAFSFIHASDIAQQSADIILTNNNLQAIITAIKLSKACRKKIKQNLFFAFFYNVIGIPLAAMGTLNPMVSALAMALSSFCVVSNALSLNLISKKF